MPTKIYDSILTLRRVFIDYANEEGDKFTLTKGELVKVLRKEVLVECDDKTEVEKYLQILDTNGDEVIDFQEYMDAIAYLAVTMFTPVKTKK